jgi:hypothetical protein
MRAEYIAALSYMKMQILKTYDIAEEMFGDCIMIPEKAPDFGGRAKTKDPSEADGHVAGRTGG